MNFIEGEILYIDKPYKWTSFDAVKRIRGALLRRMKIKKLKVGHAGTLDPLATGVMVICTGRSTRLIESLQAGVKEYIATINGERAYKRARRGAEVNIKPKILVIDEIELLNFSPESITIRVVCSKGTYIRALARDIGEALDSGGHLTALQRTRVGDISLEQCMSIEKAIDILKEVPIEMPDDDASATPTYSI